MSRGQQCPRLFLLHMQIKLLSSVAVDGQHHAAGSIVDFDFALSLRLIKQSRAMPYTAPIQPDAIRETMPDRGSTPEGVKFKKASK